MICENLRGAHSSAGLPLSLIKFIKCVDCSGRVLNEAEELRKELAFLQNF